MLLKDFEIINKLRISFLCIFIAAASFLAPNKASANDTYVLDPINVSGASCYSLGMQIAGGVCVSPYVTVQMRSINTTWQNFQGWTREDVYQYTKGLKLGDDLWSPIQMAEMLADTEGDEYKNAINDIENWRMNDAHYPYPLGQLDWLSVNWDDYGAQDAWLTEHEVLWNFVTWALYR